MTFGFPPGRSGYELDPLARLDYVELGFKRFFAGSSYVEIGWNLWGTLPHFLPQRKPLVYLGILAAWQRLWSPFPMISSPRWTPRRGVAARLAAPLCGSSPTRRYDDDAKAERRQCDRCSATPRPMADVAQSG